MQTVTRSAEARLVENLNEIHEQRDNWTAVLFNLSELLEEYKSDYQVKIAVNLANDLLADYEGAIYVFADGSLAVLTSFISPTLLNKLIFQLRYLYMDDPLAYTDEGQENAAFATIFRLGAEWQKCLDAASRKMMKAARASGTGRARAPGQLSVTKLAAIERDLTQIDITAAIRRQPVCALGNHGTIRRVFDELYFHIGHLRQLLKADVDFLSNRWLFKYVTQVLDERAISILKTKEPPYFAQPVSLNMNVEGILSSWFTEFDAGLSPAYKVSIVLEISVVDVFADMAAYIYARDMAQRLGYRVCIDGLSVQSFQQIDREKLRADLVKVQWNADVQGDLNAPENRGLIQAVKACGAGRMILCRCDGKAAVEYGQALGLSLFQGRYLDGLLDPQALLKN